MSAVVEERTYTPEELLSLPDEGRGFELVAGRLVEKKKGSYASWVAARITSVLARFGESPDLGLVFSSEGSYQCFPDDPRKVRKPDVSFIRRGRLPGERPPEGHVTIPPDLAVEVVSPRDTAYEVDAKVQEYLAAGFPLVWVVNPRTRTIHIYRPGRSVELLGPDDELTSADLLPELRCRVVDLFTLPAPQ